MRDLSRIAHPPNPTIRFNADDNMSTLSNIVVALQHVICRQAPAVENDVCIGEHDKVGDAGVKIDHIKEERSYDFHLLFGSKMVSPPSSCSPASAHILHLDIQIGQ